MYLVWGIGEIDDPLDIPMQGIPKTEAIVPVDNYDNDTLAMEEMGNSIWVRLFLFALFSVTVALLEKLKKVDPNYF